MPALAWIVLAVAVWLVVGTVVGLIIGRIIRRRDQQTPRDAAPPPEDRAGVAPLTRPQHPTDEPRGPGVSSRP